MEPYRWQPTLGDEVIEPVADGLWVPCLAVGPDEEQPSVGPLVATGLPPALAADLVGPKGGDRLGAERDDPIAGVALDVLGDGSVCDGGDLLDDGEVPTVEVDVLVA
ncbi:hypothetical protein Psuf_033890 [Phytohabitans suffuscus]|uniref:Uncharacterized protein n=1 Tax=Phytohabitans suffuscus TaxID=624315 RepID=A0A6F8YJ16_9ACTN|nr:hypothetical protein Psuf_033890 [Phytohabitans suffuscus]